jgi:5'-nucleotidase
LRILFVNDDGIEANGLRALINVFGQKHDVSIVAPRIEQSAKGHSFTMNEPVQLGELRSRVWWVEGTPADCVYIALHQLECTPDVIISGINQGTNLGSDIWYSGTVGAAREGALNSFQSFAVSTKPLENTLAFYEERALVLFHLLPSLIELPGLLYNINISLQDDAQIRVAPLGKRLYHSRVDARTSPNGKKYYWIGGPPYGYKGDPNCDVALYEKGFTTITPLTLNGTEYSEIDSLQKKRFPSHAELGKTH